MRRRDVEDEPDALTQMLQDVKDGATEAANTYGKPLYVGLLFLSFIGATSMATTPPEALLGKRNPLPWKSEECTVLAAGIQYLGTCSLGGKGDAQDIRQGNYSACSPFTWCAGENDVCQCTGTVRFSDGGSENFIDKDVNGTIDCTGEAFGADPAWGKTKSCSCRPEALRYIDAEFEAANQQCDAVATSVLERGVPGTSLMLTEMTNNSVDSETAPMEAFEIPDFLGGIVSTCSHRYLAWGLVSVAGPTPGSVLHRCAYRYGASKLSVQDKGEVSQDLLSELSQSLGSKRSCEVVPDTMPMSCLVALRKPSGGLISSWSEAFEGILEDRYRTCWAVLSVGFLICLVLAVWRLQQNDTDDEFRSNYRRI